jgi:hypothetical protein
VQKALSSTWNEQDIEATIDGRADRRVGGRAWHYCESKASGVWAANLFAGCIPYFVREVAERRRALAAEKKNLERRVEDRAELEVCPPRTRAADPGLVQLFAGMAPRSAAGELAAAGVLDAPPSDAELLAAADAFDAELSGRVGASSATVRVASAGAGPDVADRAATGGVAAAGGFGIDGGATFGQLRGTSTRDVSSR